MQTRKGTGFKSLQVNCCKINQVSSKCQLDFLDKTCKKGPKQKIDHHNPILHIQNSFGIKFHHKLEILNFWTKLTQKGYFQSKNEKKKENHYQILHIRISLGAKFQLQQKGYFLSDQVNITIESFIFKLVIVPILGMNWQFWVFGPSLFKKVISAWTQKKWTSPLNSAYSFKSV